MAKKRKLLTKRQSKKLIYLIISLCIAGATWLGQRYGWIDVEQSTEQASVAVQQTQPGLYPVQSFEDGDTITVDMNGTAEKVRFIGVDTPENKDPRKPVQCYGKMASEFTKTIIGDNPVRLEADPTNTNRDRYNRLLRYVYLPDGTLVNAEIIKQGYGFAYISFPFEKKEEFQQYQADARDQNKGLWGACELTPNEYGGYTPNAVEE
ncbi:thermonuclease family protein [Candidatus Saccharibacteria bacterium]|nr:thermonuclease family protein [Candidatus Saccharibacteria bacterium]